MKVEKDLINSFGTNAYLVYDEDSKDAYIIDAPSILESFEETIEKKGLKPKYLLLTHGHFDHIVAAKYLKKKYNIPIVCHILEKDLMKDSDQNLSEMFGSPLTLEADQYLEGEEGIFDGVFKYIHTPGHTIGGVCYVLEDDMKIFSGDTLFQQSIGRSDFPTGDYDSLIESIKNKLYVYDDECLVYPGHGPNTRIGEEKEGNPFLR